MNYVTVLKEIKNNYKLSIIPKPKYIKALKETILVLEKKESDKQEGRIEGAIAELKTIKKQLEEKETSLFSWHEEISNHVDKRLKSLESGKE